MNAGYPLVADSFAEEEIRAVTDVMRSGKYTMGERVKEFESALAEWLGVKNAIMVNSGSSANLLLIESLIRRLNPETAPLKAGDEVLVPALSWPTTVWPLAQLGLKPVFVDVDPETLAIDLNSAQQNLSPKTKGMFLIHVLGQACDMGPYQDFCRSNGITLIEDCCESFGSYDQGQHVGTFGYGGTLSHFFSHQLTTIEGGTIFTNDDSLTDDLRSMRAHGWIRDRKDREKLIAQHDEFDPRFLFVMTGYNVRPMELQAAVGLIQLKKMDRFLEQRREVVQQVFEWNQKFCPWLQLIGAKNLSKTPLERRQRKHSWMNMPFWIPKDAPMSLKKTMQIFNEFGIETRAIIAGNLARHPAIKQIECVVAKDLSNSDRLLEQGFMIGCHPLTSEQQLDSLRRALEMLGKG